VWRRWKNPGRKKRKKRGYENLRMGETSHQIIHFGPYDLVDAVCQDFDENFKNDLQYSVDDP